MANPQFIEEKSLSLVDVKATLQAIEKRDEELNYLSNKAKEYLDHFVP
jgi:DNA-directed RNA polymerase subunit F